MDTRFHCVYLLTSLDPFCSGEYYIGYTVNPLRRLRQHNGELVNGAKRTRRRGRPWAIVCCVSGFPEDRAALKFEWCWQHPAASARLKEQAGPLRRLTQRSCGGGRGLSKLASAVGILHLLVRASMFSQLALRLHVFEPALFAETSAAAVAHVTTTGGPGGGGSRNAVVDAVSTVSLPLLVSTPPLFTREDTTREAFEVRYLAHDSDAPLESIGIAGGGGGGRGGGGASYSLLDVSGGSACPYDISALSQTVQEEWGGGGGGPFFPTRSHADNINNNLSEDDDYDDDDDECGSYSNCGNGGSEVGSVDCSDEEDDDECDLFTGGGGRPRGRPPPLAPGGAMRTTARSRSRSRELLPVSLLSPPPPPPPPPQLTTAASTTAPSVPLRFKHYSPADFAADYRQEQRRAMGSEGNRGGGEGYPSGGHHSTSNINDGHDGHDGHGGDGGDGCSDGEEEGDSCCTLCALPLALPYVLRCPRAPFCPLAAHVVCLAMWARYSPSNNTTTTITHRGVHGANTANANATATTNANANKDRNHDQQQQGRLVPARPCPCPLCRVDMHWGGLATDLRRRAAAEERLRARLRRQRVELRLAERLGRAEKASTGRDRNNRSSSSSNGNGSGGVVVASQRKRARSLSPRPAVPPRGKGSNRSSRTNNSSSSSTAANGHGVAVAFATAGPRGATAAMTQPTSSLVDRVADELLSLW